MMVRLVLAMLSLAGAAPAWEFTYSNTTTTEPFWIRPTEDLTGAPLLGLSRYSAQPFLAPYSALFTITSIASGGWNNFIVLYQGAFSAAAPLTNAIAANDDFGGVGQSRIMANLTGGTQYYLVTTGYWLFDSGAFANTVSNTPEPATWALLMFGCAVLMLRRQLLPQRARAVGNAPQSPQGKRSPGRSSWRA